MDYASFYRAYFPFWERLDAKDQALLCENTTEVRFEKEQALHDNMGCSGLFIVQSGRLRIYIMSEDGKEITLYRLSRGELCMLSASCVLQSITFDVYVEAEEPSVCYRVSSAAFGDLTERVPEVKIYALELAVSRFSDVMWIMQQIVFMSMDKRLAIFLMEELQHGQTDVVAMTHEQIAKHLGSAREVVTRLLRHFANDGIVEVSRKGISVKDRTKLRHIAYE